jgi:hypothetical protein
MPYLGSESTVITVIPRRWGSLFDTEDAATNCYTFHRFRSLLPKLLSRSSSDPPPFCYCLCWSSLFQALWQGVPAVSEFLLSLVCRSPQYLRLKQWAPPKMAPNYSTPRDGRVIKWSSSPMLAWHTGTIHVKPNPLTEFKACDNCGFLLQLELPESCYLGYLKSSGLSYSCGFGFSSTLEPGLELWTVNSASPFCLSVLFNYLITSFLIPNVLPLFSSKYSLSFVAPILLMNGDTQTTPLIYHL